MTVNGLTASVPAEKTAVSPAVQKARSEQGLEQAKLRARERMALDTRVYSREQLQEIERLYQVANEKWRTPEARKSLEQLLAQYDRANRTGCALLYLG